jgi:PhnB protein
MKKGEPSRNGSKWSWHSGLAPQCRKTLRPSSQTDGESQKLKEKIMSENATTRLIPRLCCRNASAAAEFYQKAFGAEKIALFQGPDGRVMHAELKIDGTTFFLVDEMPDHGSLSPLSLTATPVTLYLNVADSDAVFTRAVAAGCQVQMPLQDMFWGDRFGLVADPYGHKWEIATTIRKVSNEDLQKAVSTMAACGEVTTTVR